MSSTEQKQTAQPVDSEPEVNILRSVPGFSGLHPEIVKEKDSEGMPWSCGKFGSHVTLNEAKSMIFVGENTKKIPVPKIFACYTYGPIYGDILDFGCLFDTYIFMSFVEGQTLDKAWETYDKATKHRVNIQLKQCICELHEINLSDYIGSVSFGPVTDPIWERLPNQGPFTTEEAFSDAPIDAYQLLTPRCHIKHFLAGLLSQNKYQIVFTHGDLRLANIMVNDEDVTRIALSKAFAD
ncbi:hypothetical protein BDV36DRAFT_310021 [Aspergillus pseudocaelatus]|uniref:non-specific serine/threonine protein kinase n=1 Tax=Aspergillus pseudocaelatus TaxID=1825620 RepID=A0ABQ6WHC8_9EURO|nr:hypothetical protein BDV36DRAFT_310021 [Aspergillus pseudocaelatus]